MSLALLLVTRDLRVVAKAVKGEGSLGGHVIGHTRSGNPIYGAPRTPRTAKEAATHVAHATHAASSEAPGYPGIEKVRKNWTKQIDTAGIPPWAFDLIDQAQARNRENPLFREAQAKYGFHEVAVLRNGDRHNAERIGVVTNVHYAPAMRPEQYLQLSTSAPAPDQPTVGGSDSILRHEYAHSICDQLTRDPATGPAWRALADTVDARRISKYAGSSRDELFCETFATVTHPLFDPTAWSPSERDYFDAFKRLVWGDMSKAILMTRDFMVLLEKAVKRPGSRGGKFYRNAEGHVVYGDPPAGAREVNDGQFKVLHQEEHAHGLYYVEDHGAGIHGVHYALKRKGSPGKYIATANSLEGAQKRILAHRAKKEPAAPIPTAPASLDLRTIAPGPTLREGSGAVIGTTSSGKPIYAERLSPSDYPDFTAQDHREAAAAHLGVSAGKRYGFRDGAVDPSTRSERFHHDVGAAHQRVADRRALTEVQKSEPAKHVKAPGSRGAAYWIDEKGQVRYDPRPKKTGKKYIAKITYGDGTTDYIYPEPGDVDEHGTVKPEAVAGMFDRELLGAHGYHPAGHKHQGRFWQNKGKLLEYEPRTNPITGKVEVHEVQRHSGIASIEYRDDSVAEAAGDMSRFDKFRVVAGAPPAAPAHGGDTPTPSTGDVPPIEHLGIHRAPDQTATTRVAIGEPLRAEEDPIVLSTALLDATMGTKRERGEAADAIADTRKIKPLPAWAVNKFTDAAHLQREMSRDGGKPMSTLITFGLWNRSLKEPRTRRQLIAEWDSELRYHVKRAVDAYKLTDDYRAMAQADADHGIEEWSKNSARRSYLRSRQEDLYNEAVATLLESANAYVPNDIPTGPQARFDTFARNAVMSALYDKAREEAEARGALGLAPDTWNDSDAETAGAAFMSPKEQYELQHYGPMARQILSDATADLSPAAQAVFNARMWSDEDSAGEANFNAARDRARKRGRAAEHWGRPWVKTAEDSSGVESVAERLKDLEIPVKGKLRKLGEMSPELQRYHLQKLYDQTVGHIQSKLRTADGRPTPAGATVERWLRLESKLADTNRRIVMERTSHPIIQMPITPHVAAKVAREHIGDRAEVKFFREPGSNRDLGVKLGVLNPDGSDNFGEGTGIANVKHAEMTQRRLDAAKEFHQHVQHAARLDDVAPHLARAVEAQRAAGEVGHWQGGAWHETNGVEAMHAAAKRLAAAKMRGTSDDAAVGAFARAANHVRQHLPAMVDAYVGKLQHAVPDIDDEELAGWRARAHANYRTATGRTAILEHEAARRARSATVQKGYLAKAINDYVFAVDCLRVALR